MANFNDTEFRKKSFDVSDPLLKELYRECTITTETFFYFKIKTTNDIVYLDDEVSRVIGELSITKGDNVVKENENFLSRIRQVSYSSLGQESYPLVNKNYNKENILSTEEFIASKGIETGKLEITKDNFDRYFNILNQHNNFKDNRNLIASELYNYHVSPENKEEMKKMAGRTGLFNYRKISYPVYDCSKCNLRLCSQW